LQGDQHVGSGGGDDTSTLDVLKSIPIQSGNALVDYDFCEMLPGSISGHVHEDPEGDCDIGDESAETPIAGVTMQLLDSTGKVIATTTTMLMASINSQISIRARMPSANFSPTVICKATSMSVPAAATKPARSTCSPAFP